MTLTDERKQKLVDELYAQLDLPPSVAKLILKAKPKTLDLSGLPSRSQRLGEAPRDLPEVSEWARTVVCPRCEGLLTPVKAKADKQWGESITYQCHNPYQKTMCLLMVEISTSNRFKVTTEDFTNSDFSWKPVALDSVPVLGEMKPVDTYPFKLSPPNPWVKKTVRSVVFQTFWQEFMKKKSVDAVNFKFQIHKDYPQYGYEKVSPAVDSLPVWMEEHTGFVFAKSNGVYKCMGKGKGNLSLAPFSSAKYRLDFGF